MISNASPLIYLGKLNKLDLLIKLFDKIEITSSVYEEVICEDDTNKPEVEITKGFINRNLIIVNKLHDKTK